MGLFAVGGVWALLCANIIQGCLRFLRPQVHQSLGEPSKSEAVAESLITPHPEAGRKEHREGHSLADVFGREFLRESAKAGLSETHVESSLATCVRSNSQPGPPQAELLQTAPESAKVDHVVLHVHTEELRVRQDREGAIDAHVLFDALKN